MHDLRYAFRQLAKSPSFTIVALLTLALGIGVNTAMFSFLDALLLRAAPFPQGERIHQIGSETGQPNPSLNYSEVETRELRERATVFSSLTVTRNVSAALAEPGRPAEQVTSILASADFFTTFGVQPFLGRAFTAEETQPGNNQVIVLSHAFWQERFGGDRAVIGRTVRIDAAPVTIIGVMPPEFGWRILWGKVGFWRPINFTADQLKSRTYRGFNLIGLLKPGASAVQAEAELAPVAANQIKNHPDNYSRLHHRVIPLHEAQMDDAGRNLAWLLLGLSGFVLLIACANLANLQLARSTTTARELAIRAAIGDSRWQLIQEQLAVSVLLSVLGGMLGVVLALWVNSALSSAVYIGGEPGGLLLSLNAKILSITFAVATLTGVLFGIVPAWLSSRPDLVAALKSQSRGATSSRGQRRIRQALIVGEVALALVLLGGAAVMQRGFDKLLQKDLGWDTESLLTGVLAMPEKRFPEPADRIAFYRQVQARLERLPGAESVTLTTSVPLWGYGTQRPIYTDKQDPAQKDTLPKASHVMIAGDFFPVMGVRLIDGRLFASDIKPDDPQVSIVNEALARQLWPGESAIGKRIASVNGAKTTWTEVIGVVGNTEGAGIGNDESPYQVFRPLVQDAWSWVCFVIRSPAPAALGESARRAIAEIDPDLPATDVRTVPDAIRRSAHNFHVIAQLLVGFALLGLGLAAVGLYGVISHVVAQRTTEFGIRLALGATPTNVLRLVLSQGATLTAIGLIIGAGGAWGLNRFFTAIMPRLDTDTLALSGTALLLLAIALLACWLPARRATKVDPMVALRTE